MKNLIGDILDLDAQTCFKTCQIYIIIKLFNPLNLFLLILLAFHPLWDHLLLK